MQDLEDYFAFLDDTEKEVFSTIAERAFRMGYRARRDKTSALGYSFTHSKVKKQILRFTSAKGKPVLRVKFFASPSYSEYFHEAIRATIEEYGYRYTGCYGCGRCSGTEGYRYRYADGREYFRCGSELIELVDFHNLPTEELLELLAAQHESLLSSPAER